MDRISSSVWLSESDMDVVGKDACKGVIKFEAAAGGREPKVLQAILKDVVGKGKGAGPEAKVGTSYYNIGVMMASIVAEGVRKAAEKAPNGPVTGPWLNAGIQSISNFTAEGMLPGITVTARTTKAAARDAWHAGTAPSSCRRPIGSPPIRSWSGPRSRNTPRSSRSPGSDVLLSLNNVEVVYDRVFLAVKSVSIDVPRGAWSPSSAPMVPARAPR